MPLGEVSKDIGRLWALTDKSSWARAAEIEQLEHAKKYPDYKFAPKQKPRGERGVGKAAGSSNKAKGKARQMGADDQNQPAAGPSSHPYTAMPPNELAQRVGSNSRLSSHTR